MGWGSLLFHIRWRRKLKLPNLFDELKYESVTDAQKMVLSYPYLTTIHFTLCLFKMWNGHVGPARLLHVLLWYWAGMSLYLLLVAFMTCQGVWNISKCFFEYDYEFTVLTRPLHRANCDIWWNGRFASSMHVQMHDAIMSIWAEIYEEFFQDYIGNM